MGADLKRALELAAANRARSIRQLAELVRIPSLTGEEGAAQEHIAGLLRDIGGEVETAEPDVADLFRRFPEIAQYPTHWQHDLVLPYAHLPSYAALCESKLDSVLNYRGRPNIVARWRGTGGGRSLILNGHIDTVTVEPADAWTRDLFGATVEGDVMYGRGTSDMKGGLMAAIMALTYLQESGIRLCGDVVLQSVVNEEHAGNGTLDLVRRGVAADAAVVLEPTGNTILVSHPGGLYWQLTVPGTQRSPGARWNGERQEGVSAIEKLPPLIEALLTLERELNVEAGSERGQKPFSLVIGKIAGGHYETATAGEVTVRGGAYFLPSVGAVGDVMARFRAAVERANDGDPFLSEHRAAIAFLHHDDSTRQSPQIPIAVHAAGVLARRGCEARISHGPFCCDMRHLVNRGRIPSIIFGPGSIAQAHKPDEYISLREYTDCIEHLIVLIGEWCRRAQ